MLPRHRRDFYGRELIPTRSRRLYIDHHILKLIQVKHIRERVVALGCETFLCMWSRDDGEVSAEGFFDFLVEVVSSWVSAK